MKKYFKYLLLILLVINISVVGYFRNYGQLLCSISGYSCLKVKRGDSWEKLFPATEDRNIVMRLNRMNIPLYPGATIAIPNYLHSLGYMDLAPLRTYVGGNLGQRLIIVDLNQQAFGAYDESGKLIHWGPVSGGKGYCPDVHRRCTTPRGTFYIYSKGGSGCISSIYPIPRGGAPMPFCMFFKGGFALHGSYELPGYNASHGCVRLLREDAEWLNKYFTAGGHTKVIVR